MLFSLCLVRLMLIPDNADDWKVRKKEVNIHWISSLRRLLPISSFSRSEKDENFDSEWKKDSSRPKGCIKIELNSNQKIIVAIDNFLSFFTWRYCGRVWSGQRGGEVHCCVRRTHSLAAIRAQSHSLLGRLEGLGWRVTAATGRRKEALELERVWLRERKATALSLRNGFNILMWGFAQLD